MGKCISKQPLHGFHEFESNSYIAFIDEFTLYKGQSESKKLAKRATSAETKGTSISFGFNKKKTGANKKHTDSYNATTKEKEKEKAIKFADDGKYHTTKPATVITNPGVYQHPNVIKDDNGNTGPLNFEGDDVDGPDTSTISANATGRSPRLQPPKKANAEIAPSRNNRFGFRQTNIVRPASAGLTPKVSSDFDMVANNNNNNNMSNNYQDKRRSRSASNTNSVRAMTQITGGNTYNNNNNANNNNNLQSEYSSIMRRQNTQLQMLQQQQHADPKITSSSPVSGNYQPYRSTNNNNKSVLPTHPIVGGGAMNSHHQLNRNSPYAVVDSGLHTNVIVKPTPQHQPPTVVASKFTLHSTNLPKPQYPVPISLTTTTTRYVSDTKGAKHAVNVSRKGLSSREESLDSGISSYDSSGPNQPGMHMDDRLYAARARSRNLEIVPSGRHKFAVRDLDTLTDDSVVPLSLPKLPSVFSSSNQTIPLGGLVRAGVSQSSETGSEYGANDNRNFSDRKSSIVSSDAESYEEEKLMKDNNASEKSLKGAILKEYAQESSKTSSPGSSRASWCNAGESMAFKADCSSLSFSSSDESNVIKVEKRNSQADVPDEEDLSSVTITMANHSILTSGTSVSITESENLQRPANPVKLFTNVQGDGTKFAEMAATISDSLQLDDVTSPTDSLVSSCTDSEDVKRNKKKLNDSIKEKNLDDISPELEVLSPLSPGTPTHASNSLSMSDEARDFLIDDEIADQPQLVLNDKKDDILSSNVNLFSHTETPTLMESMSAKVKMRHKPKQYEPFAMEDGASPALSRKSRSNRISRTESLDTLSPCESIASDDMMMDFDNYSSIDSIDNRPPRSNDSGSINTLHETMDEDQLWTDLEMRGGEIMREWSTMLRSQKHTSRESIASQLPARATRLLQRRLQNNSNTPSHTGSDSPRSVDSNSRRTTPLYKPPSNTQLKDSNDDLLQLDKSFRNTILQDVVNFKTQLVRLRRILQEDEEKLMRTDTLNPFENNGPFFNACIIDQNSADLDSNKQTAAQRNNDQQNAILEDQRQELADLRRQVVFLQGQMDDKDRTIRIQQTMITKLEAEIDKTPEAASPESTTMTTTTPASSVEMITAATQTDRLRPLSIGQEGLNSRSKSQVRPPANKMNSNGNNNPKSTKSSLPKKINISSSSSIASSSATSSSSVPSSAASSAPASPTTTTNTQISSVYAKLSSVKPTANGGKISRPTAIRPPNINGKSVRTTFIGNGQSQGVAGAKKASTIPTPLVRSKN